MAIGNLIAAGLGAGSKLIGGIASDKSNKKLQMKFAKNAIQWKTQDALKAGIHPLYALGAPTMSPSVSLGQTGAALSDMGQDIGRAIEAGGTSEDRVLRKLQLERAGLENELLKSQISQTNRSQLGPGSPVGASGVAGIEGQGQPDMNLPVLGLVKGNKGVATAQQAEDVHGEVADALYFVNLLNQVGMPQLADIVAKEYNTTRDAVVSSLRKRFARNAKYMFSDTADVRKYFPGGR